MILKTIDGVEYICIPLDDIRALKGQKRRFEPPTLAEVKKFCKERKNNVNPIKWWNFYNAKNWMIGKTKMSKWQSAVITWEDDKTNLFSGSNLGEPPPEFFGVRSSTAVQRKEYLKLKEEKK